MLQSKRVTQNLYDWTLRVKIPALLEQELEGLLVYGDSQIELTPLVFPAEKIDQFVSVLLARVTRQVQEFKIQVVEIESAGDKRILEALINDFVDGLRIRKGVQNQDSFGSEINLSLGLSKPQPGARPEGEQDEQKKGRTKGYPSDSVSTRHYGLRS